MTNRLFIALEIPNGALDFITGKRDSIYGPDSRVRWESRDKLHITLKFLGDTGTELIEPIMEMLQNLSGKSAAMELEFTRFGMFYREKNPSILWLGLKENLQLNTLFAGMDNGLAELGFKKENREFKPHLTILRIKGKEDIQKLKKFVSEPELNIKFRGERITLFKSTLKPSGSVYEEIKSFLLK